jgi:hypothetical protein
VARPSREVRAAVYERDRARCIYCGDPRITFQHRRAVGAGGSKIPTLEVDGLAACQKHNDRFESDLQTIALRNGWKVRRWVADPARVPVWYACESTWCVLDPTLRTGRRSISSSTARRMMDNVYGEEYETWL